MSDHAIVRAKERYGLDLSMADMGEIAVQCLAGKGMLVERKANGQIFLLRFQGKVVVPLISALGSVITFYPRSHYSGAKREDRQNRPRMAAERKRPKKTRDHA